jgi:hypothetical protein
VTSISQDQALGSTYVGPYVITLGLANVLLDELEPW